MNMRIALTIVLIFHGLIHFMGFAKAYDLGNMAQFTKGIPKPMGWLWLLSGLFLITVAILYFLRKDVWPILAILAVLLSQILILLFWGDAKYGTIANVIILAVAIVGFAANRFENTYQNDALLALGNTQLENEIIKEKDLVHLPVPVQKYLGYVGVLGKPRVQNLKITFEGKMRDKGKDWFQFSSEQYNFIASPARLFFMKAKVKGLSTVGYHAYKNGKASMLIKLLSIFTLVKIDGQELFATETATFFNDLCLFAPATLIDDRITWEVIDDYSTKATFATNGTRISAILHFNEKGQLVNFVSEDRISVAEMKTLPFSTPVKNYRNINGYNLPTYGEAIWHYTNGAFVYGRFNVKSVAYNVKLVF